MVIFHSYVSLPEGTSHGHVKDIVFSGPHTHTWCPLLILLLHLNPATISLKPETCNVRSRTFLWLKVQILALPLSTETVSSLPAVTLYYL